MSEKEWDALRESIREQQCWESVYSLSIEDGELVAVEGDRRGDKAACAEVIRRPM